MQTTKRTIRLVAVAAAAFMFVACVDIQRPAPEPFYAETTPPAKQEFRWSNGRMPRSFDPARAAAAPETDLVRALFEGLTETDPRTLEAMPAAAEKWSSSDDNRIWTFQLRKNARWSNGRRVTANDFVASWKRLLALGDKTAHRELFQNIVGFRAAKPIPSAELPDAVNPSATPQVSPVPTPANAGTQNLSPSPGPKKPDAKVAGAKLGVEAIDEFTLKVALTAPDADLPRLVAHPIFRPVYGDGSGFADGLLDNGVVTNGAFRVALVDKTGIALERSETYWNKAAVKLERVRFVAKDTAESALDAYKKGEIDALTNAMLEPLAIKLLAPYDDFRQTTFSALNFYRFDETRPPFNDRRVREALAIAIDRERLSSAEMQGVTEPAKTFLAAGAESVPKKLEFDPAKAKKLLETAGYPNGEGMAHVKLLINRNEAQLRIARAVAKMWKQNLNLETEITVKEAAEIGAAESSHEFDLVRHGVVLPTTDKAVSLTAILRTEEGVDRPSPNRRWPTETGGGGPSAENGIDSGGPSEPFEDVPELQPRPGTMSEEEALVELKAIPLYFPRSFSLVKPYVHGFEVNGLDAVYLPGVSINSNWQPEAQRGES